MQWRKKAWWDIPIWTVVLTSFILLCQQYFFSGISIFPNQIKQQSSKTTQQRLWGKLTILHSTLFFPQRIIDNMGCTSPTCFSTWAFIFIKASSPEDNKFVDAMGFTSPTCFSTLLVTHLSKGWALEMKERVWQAWKDGEKEQREIVGRKRGNPSLILRNQCKLHYGLP